MRTPQKTFREYAEEFCRVLRLYRQTTDELVAAARAGRLDAELARWLTPDCHHRRGTLACHHGFPQWWIRASSAHRLAAIMRRFRNP